MKKITKNLIIASIITIMFILFLVLVVTNYNYYKISPVICELAIGSSPEEFVNTSGVDTMLFRGYTYSKLDTDGNLILILSDKELEQWKKTSLSLEILRIVTNDAIDLGIDERYTPENFIEEISINSAKRVKMQVSSDFTEITYGEEGSRIISGYLVNACAIMQIINGFDINEYRIEEIMYNNEGDILVHNLWTSDGVKTTDE